MRIFPRLLRLCVVWGMLFAAVYAFAQEPDVSPELTIIKINSNDIQNGEPSEAVWAKIEPFTSFFFPWEKETAPKTSLKMCHDGQKIFFRWDAADADVVAAGNPSDEMDVCGSDRVEIFLDSSDCMSRYYGLEMDPSGRILDYEARFYRQFDYPHTVPGVEIRTCRMPDGYTVAGTLDLPTLKQLGLIHTLPSGTYLRAGFFRAEFSHSENSTENKLQEKWLSWKSTGTKEADFHVPAALGWVHLAQESEKEKK